MYTLAMNQAIPVTQARKDLLKLVDKINGDYSRVDLTKNGRVTATLVSPDYLDSLEETIYTLEHSLKDIREAEEEIAKNKYATLEEYLKEYYARQKLPIAGKSKKKSR